LSPGFNAGNHDSARAEIENTGKRREVQVGDTRHWNNAAAPARRDHLFKEGDVTSSVLHVKDDEVESASIKHRPNAGCKKFEEQLAENDISLLQALPKIIHRPSSSVERASLNIASFSMKRGFDSTWGLTTFRGTSPR
jgi:hypothetical protein